MNDRFQVATLILLAAGVSILALFLAKPELRDAVTAAVLQIF